jgi:hypothetical protein
MTVTLGGQEDIEVLNQDLELETAKTVDGTPFRFQQTTARTFWKSQSSQRNEETSDSLHAATVGVPATSERAAPTNPMKNRSNSSKTRESQEEEMRDATV